MKRKILVFLISIKEDISMILQGKANMFMILIALLFTIIMVDQVVARELRRDGKNGLSSGRGLSGVLGVSYKMGLTGFYFNFEGAVDHHIKEVSAFLHNDSDPRHSAYSFSYNDNSKDDNFYYEIAWQELPANSTIYSKDGNTSDGVSVLLGTKQERPGIPVLVGFRLKFTDDDHHLWRIAVRLYTAYEAVYAKIIFRDKNGDDPFYYELAYAMIPECDIKCTGCIDGHGKNTERETISACFPALQGFDIMYTGYDYFIDNHMNKLGVLLKPNEVNVWFGDKKLDDKFSWDVWYVDVAPPRRPVRTGPRQPVHIDPHP